VTLGSAAIVGHVIACKIGDFFKKSICAFSAQFRHLLYFLPLFKLFGIEI